MGQSKRQKIEQTMRDAAKHPSLFKKIAETIREHNQSKSEIELSLFIVKNMDVSYFDTFIVLLQEKEGKLRDTYDIRVLEKIYKQAIKKQENDSKNHAEQTAPAKEK